VKAERARLDAQRTDAPKTRLVAQVPGAGSKHEGGLGVSATHYEDEAGALQVLADGQPVVRKTAGGLGIVHCEHCMMTDGLMTDCGYRGHYRCAASQNNVCCECGEALS
jgi:hypothetical protein